MLLFKWIKIMDVLCMCVCVLVPLYMLHCALWIMYTYIGEFENLRGILYIYNVQSNIFSTFGIETNRTTNVIKESVCRNKLESIAAREWANDFLLIANGIVHIMCTGIHTHTVLYLIVIWYAKYDAHIHKQEHTNALTNI